MEVTKWTQAEINSNFKNCHTLGDLINTLESHFQKNGDVICEISVDGVLLSEDDEHNYNQSPIGNFSEFLVKTNTHEGLFLESLDSLCFVLSEVEKGLIQCADNFRLANLKMAQEQFDNSIKKAQLALDLNTYFSQASEQYLEPQIRLKSQGDWEAVQKNVLTLSYQVYETFQKKDYVLLSDLLEYEFSNVLQDWKSWVLNIKSHFRVK